MALFRGKDLKPKREIFLPELILDATGQRRRQQRAQNVKNCREKKMILTDPILVLRQEQKKIQEQFLRYSLSTLYKTTRIYERQRKHSGNSKQELKLVVWPADVLLICRLHRGSLFTSGRLLLTRKARGIFSRSEKKPDEKRVTRDSRSFSFACWANAEFEVIFFPARMHTPNPQTQQ